MLRLRRARTNLAVEAIAARLLRDLERVVRLQVHPKLRADAEITSEPHRGVGGDPASPERDIVEPGSRNADRSAQSVHAQAERLHEVGLENFAGVNRRNITVPPCGRLLTRGSQRFRHRMRLHCASESKPATGR